MIRMMNIALAFTTALALSSCGSKIEQKDLIGFWQASRQIDTAGKETEVAAEEKDIFQLTDKKLIAVQADNGRADEAEYRLDGNKLIVKVDNKGQMVDKEFFIVESVTETELRMLPGKDAENKDKVSKFIAIRSSEEAFNNLRKP